MEEKMKVLELFGGIGSPRKALERLGIEHKVVDYVEIDKYAVKSYNAIFNENYEPIDICDWDKKLDVDLIFHGSPCQDFSVAGKNKGGEKGSGTRSSLLYETVRIVRNLRPKYVVWENVKNVISKKHIDTFNHYLEELKKLGYENYYQVLNAKDYGIPQNRERVFTVSILGNQSYEFPKGEECENKIQVVGNYMPSGHDASRIVDENGLAPTVKENHGTVTAVLQRFEFPPKQELKLKLKDLLEDEVDEKYFLSEKMLNCFLSDGTGKYPRRERFLQNINRKNQDIGNSITTRAGTRPTDNFVKIKEATKKEYKEFEKSKGYTPNMFNPYNKSEINDTAPTQTTQCGSTTTSATHLVKEYRNYISWEDPKGRINTQDHRAFKDDTISGTVPAMERGVPKILLNSAEFLNGNSCEISIRKLTPKECWRLMGFDDEDFDKAKEAGISDTQLYKQAGNSIVVNVLEKIFKELL